MIIPIAKREKKKKNRKPKEKTQLNGLETNIPKLKFLKSLEDTSIV